MKASVSFLLQRSLVFALFAATAGCAGLGTLDCKSNWYAVGQRDGRLHVSPQDDFYALSCPGAVDVARYRQGWRDGFSETPRL